MRIDKPLTHQESKQGDLIPEGIYPFEVVEAIDDVSRSSGAEMIKLKLKIYLPDGRERFIYDYLLEKMAFKLAHFFECIGRWEKYESGDFYSDDCLGGSGEVKIYIQKSKDPAYADKSAVADYMLSDEQEHAKAERKVAAVKQAEPPPFDDDIPF